MFRECILPVKSVPVEGDAASPANESLLPGQIHSVTGSLKGSVRNIPLAGTGTCLWSWWGTCAYPWLDIVISSSFLQVANLFTDVTAREESVQSSCGKSVLKKSLCPAEEMPPLFWYSINIGNFYYLQGWPAFFFKSINKHHIPV